MHVIVFINCIKPMLLYWWNNTFDLYPSGVGAWVYRFPDPRGDGRYVVVRPGHASPSVTCALGSALHATRTAQATGVAMWGGGPKRIGS